VGCFFVQTLFLPCPVSLQGPPEEAALVGAVESCLLGNNSGPAPAAAADGTPSNTNGSSSSTASSSSSSFLSAVVAPHFAVVLKMLYDEETVTDEVGTRVD
jgi:hypothetical protein